MSAIDPHRTLGLAPGATQAEIKRAYRRLAKAFHPDAAGDRTLQRFLAIQAAYEALHSGLTISLFVAAGVILASGLVAWFTFRPEKIPLK